MGKDSKIEWTDHTFNPWVGCEKIGPGCYNCYAERDMTRKPRWANCWGPPWDSERLRTSEAYWKQPFSWQRQAEKRQKAARVFCASLADVFEVNEKVHTWRIELFEDVIGDTPWLKWQILTKRPARAYQFFNNRPDLLFGNVWLGVSVSEQIGANNRCHWLKDINPAVSFLSVEPMLGPINLEEAGAVWSGEHGEGRHWVDWVIIGCESGPNRRPLSIIHVRDLVAQCKHHHIPVFVKQLDIDGQVSKDPEEWPEDLRIRQFP